MQLVAEQAVELDRPVRATCRVRFPRRDGERVRGGPPAVVAITAASRVIFEDTGRGDDALGQTDRLDAHQRGPDATRPVRCTPTAIRVLRARSDGRRAARRNVGGGPAERLIEPLGVTHMALSPRRRSVPGRAATSGRSAASFRAADAPFQRGGRVDPVRGAARAGEVRPDVPRRRFSPRTATRLLPAGTFTAMLEPQVTLPAMGGRRRPPGAGIHAVPVGRRAGGRPRRRHAGPRALAGASCRPDVVVAINVNGGDAGP